MNNDIVPSLLETIQKQFDEEIKSNETIRAILKKQKQGEVDYTDSLSFAKELGVSLKKVLQKNINEDMLPDGRMYYNIAQRLLEPMIKQNYDLVSKQCEVTQNLLNKKANLSLKAIVPEYDEEKTASIIDYISNADKYSQREKSFLDSLETNAKSVVDDSVRKNADFHYNAGLRPKIIRTTVGKTCKWCRAMAGVYDYSKVNNTGNDVFRRHANCDCTVVYDPGNGSRTVQNVWNKTIQYKPNQNEIKKRIQLGVNQSIGKDVTPFYYGTSTPGKGKIEYDKDYKESKHKDEIEVANLLFNTFGGDIKLLNESNIAGQMMPDYLWNGKLWDLKTVTTEKSADSAIRKGLKQIISNQGGVILDYRGKEINQDILIKTIDTRMKRGHYSTVDIIIMLNDKIKIFRYKK